MWIITLVMKILQLIVVGIYFVLVFTVGHTSHLFIGGRDKFWNFSWDLAGVVADFISGDPLYEERLSSKDNLSGPKGQQEMMLDIPD